MEKFTSLAKILHCRRMDKFHLWDDKDKEIGEDFKNLPSRARYFAMYLGQRM